MERNVKILIHREHTVVKPVAVCQSIPLYQTFQTIHKHKHAFAHTQTHRPSDLNVASLALLKSEDKSW